MKLGFLDLIQSQFSLGLTVPNLNGMMLQQIPKIPDGILANMPQQVHDFLAFVSVEHLQTAYDNNAIVYSGDCTFDGSGNASATPGFKSSNGTLLQLQDMGFQFRITIPRRASPMLRTAMGATGIAATNTDFADLTATLAIFDGAPGPATSPPNPSDYPNIDFRIELLFNTITLHLPQDTFLPAQMNSDGWLVKDPTVNEVTINLPKIAVEISQTADNYNSTQVQFKGWGISSLDQDTDPAAGEMISMTPALCLHSSGVVGFGLEKIVLDLSTDFTPTEILEKNFGIGDDFTGLWIPSVRLFIAPAGLGGFAVDTWAEDMLIDFNQGLSGEFGIEVLNGAASARMEVQTICYQGKEAKIPAIQGPDTVVDSNGTTTVTRSSAIALSADGKLHLRIRGGRPIYTIVIWKKAGVHAISDFTSSDSKILASPYNNNTNINEWQLQGEQPGPLSIYITVTDQRGNKYEELLQATLLDPAVTSFKLKTVQPPVLQVSPASMSSAVKLAAVQPDNDAVHIVTTPSFAEVIADNVNNNKPISRNANGTYRIPCVRGAAPVNISVKWSGSATPQMPASDFDETLPIRNKIQAHADNFEYVYFGYDSPGIKSGLSNPGFFKEDSDEFYKAAAAYYLDHATNLNSNEPSTRDRLSALIKGRGNSKIRIYGYASYEHHNDTEHLVYNDALSHRRARTLQEMLLAIDPTVAPFLVYNHTEDNVGDYLSPAENAKGDMVAKTDKFSFAKDTFYHVAVAVYDVPPVQQQPVTATATVSRAADVETIFQTPAEITPAPQPAEKTPLFRRMAAKVRFQRNKLVLAEVNGQLDFAEEAEARTLYVQNKPAGSGNNATPIYQGISTLPGATGKPNEPKGVVDFRLAMVYNESTRKLNQTLALGFDQQNTRRGLVSMGRFDTNGFADTIASLLLFAPLLGASIEAAQTAQSGIAKDVAIALGAAEIALAAMLGKYAIKMDQVTLFGAELSFTETSPDIWMTNAGPLEEIGIIFDYGVQFKIDFDLKILRISTSDDGQKAAPFVRYKAIGFKLRFDNNKATYVPVFDTSKGYELSLGDPGALQVSVAGQDVGNLLKILSARIARENPFLIELDMALGINLGIITVDKIKVTAKINTSPEDFSISIIPTQVSINIPATLIGKGYLDMGHEKTLGEGSNQVHDGFRGYVDLTLVPLKLRIAASLGIGPVTDGNRSATSFFLGMEVQLPVAIPLGGTGMGIYGFLGLFGMHYRRLEPPEKEGALPPALAWFDEVVQGDVIDIKGWGPQLDKWSFGLGIILGTMEGGFIMNMKGMFMLELPGPRIIIFVKAIILFPKPSGVKGGSAAGILAVVDLDFNIGRLTIGMIMQYEIDSILSLRIPIEAEFNFEHAAQWHVYIGSNKLPAEAMILGIVKGYAYLMFSGDGIKGFPDTSKQLLNGLSLALGIGASLILGDYDDGLYLKVSGDLKAGIGFSPLCIYGNLTLRGELHLWVVSISAWASLTVIAQTVQNKKTNKSDFITFIKGDVCGKVSLLLFEVEGCVNIEIGTQETEKDPLELIKSMTLVSRSSALIQGQGVDRPIDGALGKAVVIGGNEGTQTDEPIPVVSIDAILALDMIAAPNVSIAETFTDPIPIAPNAIAGYYVEGADNKSRVSYTITSIKLNNELLENDLPKPANWWMHENSKDSKESGISLALLCWTPNATPHAFQQSEQLTESIAHNWGNVCDKVAPPAAVFWTFNQKPLGYSTKGWKLHGTMWPDPPETYRSTKPSEDVLVYEPSGLNIPFENKYRMLLKSTVLEHAKVITSDKPINLNDHQIYPGRVLQFPVEHTYQRRREAITESIPDDIVAYLKLEETERIFVDCQPLSGGNILLAVEDKATGLSNIIFRSFDKKNNITETFKASDFTYVKITTTTDFPTHWRDPPGPWYKDMQLVGMFMGIGNLAGNYSFYLINYQPKTKPERFSITAHPVQNMPGRKPVLLCAMELIEAAEMDRYAFDVSVKNTQKTLVTEALGGDKKRALLKPDTYYELEVEYAYDYRRDNVILPKLGTMTQKFAFRTDDKAPLRIDPWVLTTNPQNNMSMHFVEDKVKIVFTDDSVIQLYRAYGHELRVKLYKANGDHPPQTSEEMLITDNLALNPNMSQEDTGIKSAFHHTLDELVDKLPCIKQTNSYKKSSTFTLPIDLLRNTTYTMDIESNQKLESVGKEPVTPLYRVSFTTSRYLSMKEMAGMIRGSYMTPRVLTSPLQQLEEIASDNKMQEYLLKAGLDALEPAADPNILLLWARDNENSPFYPQAIIIDTPEPIWRKRPYPFMEEVKDDEDKIMKHWVMQDWPELEIVPNAPLVKAISRNQGGTRTIVYLAPGAAGNVLKLDLIQYKFVAKTTLYGLNGFTQTAEILNIKLPVLPPWVENE